MKKFRLIFYPVYLLTVFLVLYYSIDILANMETYKEKIDMTFALRKLPVYLMVTFIFLGVLMLVEVVVENVRSYRLNQRLKKAEAQVIEYKARLYDLSQQTTGEQAESSPEQGEEEEDDY